MGKLRNFLGIEIKRSEDGYYDISQRNYIDKLLNEFNLLNAKESQYPLDPGYFKFDTVVEYERPDVYQKAIGSLLYLAINTRPDIAVATSILGRKVSAPLNADWNEVKRIFRYLKATKDVSLIIKNNGTAKVICYVDADWANDRTDRKSNSGCVIMFNGAAIHWFSKKQTCTAPSSTEAEYVSLSDSCRELKWLMYLLDELGIKVDYKVYEDNISTINMIRNGGQNSHTKHIDIRYHYVKDFFTDEKVSIEYVETNQNLADALTKPLCGNKINIFRKNVNLI